LARVQNSATQLRNIILSLLDSGSPTLQDAWEKLLGARPGTHEFARRHAEVVALFNRVYEQLLALPDEAARKQYLEYVPVWYQAIVYQRAPWSNQPSVGAVQPGDIADRNIVSHLTGLAATFALETPTAPPLDGDAVERLRHSIAEWRVILEDADFDQKLATEIRADIDHIEFLLNEQERFGAEPVMKAARDLVGTSLMAMGKQPKWAKRIGTAVAGVLVVLGGAHQAVDDINGIIEGVEKMSQEISEIRGPQKQLEQKSTPELDAGSSEAGDDNIVDAETVDPEPPDTPQSPGHQ
jgi:hypothetical protein